MKVDLRQIFLDLQKEMEANLAAARSVLKHPGDKGDESEDNWLEWLKKYLPNRYCADKASVIDSRGELSHQIDIVIYDKQYTPFVFRGKKAIFVPAESVYAILEVKQTLDRQHILYAGQKAESVRKLHRTSTTIYHATGEAEPKKHKEIIAGIVTLDNGWNPPLGKSFEKALFELTDDQRLHLGCSIQGGAFSVQYSASGPALECSTQEEALIFFFLKLVMELQKLGTVPAIDIYEYAKVLNSIK